MRAAARTGRTRQRPSCPPARACTRSADTGRSSGSPPCGRTETFSTRPGAVHGGRRPLRRGRQGPRDRCGSRRTEVGVLEAADGDLLAGRRRRAAPHDPARCRRQAEPAHGRPRYWLTLWLTDGTTLGRAYYPESGELMGGVVVPADFAKILERYLGE